MLRRTVCFAALVFCAAPALAQDLVLSRFDTAAEATRWRFDFGGAPATLSFDPTRDAAGSASSGALKVEATYAPTLGGDNKTAITTDAFGSPTNVGGYSALEADFFILPGSATSTGQPNVFGYQNFAIRNTNNYNYQSEGGRNFGPAGQWFHVSIPTSSFAQPVDAMRALTLQLYGGPGHDLSGPVTYWIDNVRFVPEPGALGVLGAASLVLLRRRREAQRH
jgi:hypothetical protein